MMKPRLNPYRAAPEVMQALVALENAVQASGLEQTLIDLVKTRASQINGCAFCIHMHTREARGRGETEERLYLLDAWRESPLYSDRERAALAWTEALTLISQTHAPDAVYDEVRQHFAEDELVKLSLLVENSATGPARVFQAGESFFEPPGSEHLVSANASATEPASLLAVFVADDDARAHDVRRLTTDGKPREHLDAQAQR